MNGALTGIKVIDLSRNLPGPYCSMILADHGARVIAIEDKRFISDDPGLTTVNRNKDHMNLNLKKKEGYTIFLSLIKDADVFIEGFRPGVAKKLGIDYETLKGINPSIIYCSITGYGQDGPYRDMVGHDINFMSFSGVLNLIGGKDKPPFIPGIPIADVMGGGMNAVIGILLAIIARERTGEGQYIDISMTDGAIGLLPLHISAYQRSSKITQILDDLPYHQYACYNIYETADGKYISIGAIEPTFWQNLCDILGVPEYGPLQFDENHRKETIEFFRRSFSKKTQEEWIEELRDKDVCWGKIQDLPEVLNDPLFLAREMIVEVEDNKGKSTTILGIPVKLSKTPGSIRRPPIGFGESTKKILKELSYTEREIEGFSKKRVI